MENLRDWMEKEYNEKLKAIEAGFSVREETGSIKEWGTAEKQEESPGGGKDNFLDLKKTMRAAEQQVNDLTLQLAKELDMAERNGMTHETALRIEALNRQIVEATRDCETISREIDNIKQNIKSNARDGLQKFGGQIKEGFRNITEALEDKVLSGVAATKAVVEKVREANQHVKEDSSINRDTLYTNVEEHVHSIGRKWMSLNYEKDRVIAGGLDKIADAVEKSMTRGANIKEAFRDLGRAFAGKDRQNSTASLTEDQQKTVGGIRGLADNMREKMRDLEKSFDRSRQLSLANLESARELREGNERIKESPSLEKRFEQAKNESISLREEPTVQSREKTEKEIEIDT